MAPTLNPIEAVAIGASAGGIEVLSALLPSLPRDFAATVIIVQHLPRERESQLASLLATRSSLPLYEAFDKQPLERGTVYVAPPDYHLLVDTTDGQPHVALSTEAPVLFSRPSIDVLFESASEVYGRRLLGVLLTGANTDGALGLQHIRRNGGLTAVQDPAEAHYTAMPSAALALEQPSFVVTVERLKTLLQTLKSRVSENHA